MKTLKRKTAATATALGFLAVGAGMAGSATMTAQSEPGTTSNTVAVGAGCDVTNYRSARMASLCNFTNGWAGIIVDAKYANGPGGKAGGPVMAS